MNSKTVFLKWPEEMDFDFFDASGKKYFEILDLDVSDSSDDKNLTRILVPKAGANLKNTLLNISLDSSNEIFSETKSEKNLKINIKSTSYQIKGVQKIDEKVAAFQEETIELKVSYYMSGDMSILNFFSGLTFITLMLVPMFLCFTTSMGSFIYLSSIYYINMLIVSSNNLPMNFEKLLTSTASYKKSILHLFGSLKNFDESGLTIDHHFMLFKNGQNYLFLNNVQPLLITFGAIFLVKIFVRSFVNLCREHPLGWVYQISYRLNKHMGKSFFFKLMIAVQPLVIYLACIDLIYVQSFSNLSRLLSIFLVIGAFGGSIFAVCKVLIESSKLFKLFNPQVRQDLKNFNEDSKIAKLADTGPQECDGYNFLLYGIRLSKINPLTSQLYTLIVVSGLVIPTCLVVISGSSFLQLLPAMTFLLIMASVFIIYKPLKSTLENVLAILCYVAVFMIYVISWVLSDNGKDKFEESQKSLSSTASVAVYLTLIVMVCCLGMGIKLFIEGVKNIKQGMKKLKEWIRRQKLRLQTGDESIHSGFSDDDMFVGNELENQKINPQGEEIIPQPRKESKAVTDIRGHLVRIH